MSVLLRIRPIFPRISILQLGAAKMSTKTYPTTIEGFGYAFNEEGQLRQIDSSTGKAGTKPFNFKVSSDDRENQKNYEALGDVITEHVYKLLEEKGLHRIYVPSDVPQDKASFIFCTQKILKNPKKLLILIHGSGVVRAGQWARSLIINDPGLKAGSVIPYIEKGKELGYEVLITNTNLNALATGETIKGNESPSAHAATVWNEIVLPSNPEAVAIVAHSFGGVVLVELAKKYKSFFENHVFAVGLTDSVHYGGNISEHLKRIGRNWITSKEPLDTKIKSAKDDITCYSAGHTRHEMTSYSCMDALFPFFESKYEDFLKQEKEAKKPRNEL